MLHLFYYLRVNKLVRVMRTPWVRIGTALCLLIFVTPLVLQQCESTDSAYARYFDGVYFTFVTMSTVGYGDISPTSDAGKIIVIFLIVCGCAMYAVIIGEGASLIWQRGEAKLKGKINHSMEGHIVLMEEGSLTVARDLFEEILADGLNDPKNLMYVSTHDENPFHEKGIRYTRGEQIYEDDVLKRSAVRHADKVIIKGAEDSDTFFAAEAVVALNPDVDVTVWVIDDNNMDRFKRLKGNVNVIHPLTAQMLCQNMQDKIYLPLESLLTNKEGQEIYMISIPESGRTWDIEKLQPFLRQKHKILLWAVKRPTDPHPIVNPFDIKLPSGTLLWVMAENRPINIDWNQG